MKIWKIIIPDIKIIQRISTIFDRFLFKFWKPIQLFALFLVLLHFNQILKDFMNILRNSKLILTFFSLIHITSNKNYFSILINIEYRIFSQIFHSKSKNSNTFFDELHNISVNLKKFQGFKGNVRNFNCILNKFQEIYIIST
jgi:hypothetical protein